MKKYQLNAKSNLYYRTFPGLGLTQLTNIFDTVSDNNKILPRHLTRGLEDVSYFSLLLGYGGIPTPTTDLFEFLDSLDLNELRNNKNTILVFDCTFEGMPGQDLLIAQSLEYSCMRNQINPKKIFLFTGNLKPLEHHTAINVIPVFILHLSFENLKGIENGLKPFWIPGINLTSSYNLCKQNFKKSVLSLSRRNRHHRVLAHFMLSKSEIFEDSIISQALIHEKIDGMAFNHIDADILRKIGLTFDDFEEFRNKLPFIADGDFFHKNVPFDPLIDLHSTTAFSIVNETLADNQKGKSLFYSEKFLKPIINFQPMLIYGQQGINKNMHVLGFKSYESYFNLDFDDEPDDILRYKKLLISATEAVKQLRAMTRDQQIEWRFHQTELLEFNFYNVVHMKHVHTQMEKFLGLVKDIL